MIMVDITGLIIVLALAALLAWHRAKKSNESKRPTAPRKKISMRVLDDVFYFDTEHERDIFIRTAGWKKKQPVMDPVPENPKWYNYRPALVRNNRDGPRISVLAGKPIHDELDSLVTSSKRWEIIASAATREFQSLQSACEEAQKLNSVFRAQIEALKREHQRIELENPSLDELLDKVDIGATALIAYQNQASAVAVLRIAIERMYKALKEHAEFESSQVTTENKG